VSDYPTARLPVRQPAFRQRRRRWPVILVVVVLVLIGLLVVADRAAASYVENRVAGQMQAQGFSSKPHVSIEGFPFLTQLASRDFQNVKITATGEKAGPVEIDHIDAMLHGVKLNSGYSGGTVSQLNGTGLITFASLAGASGAPGLKISAVSNDEVKISIDLGIVSGSATARVTKVGANEIKVHVISAQGLPLSALGGLGDMTIPIPALPMGMKLQSVSVSAQGVLIHITGQDVSFGG
jgi:LmeA-like phospholipid-binding